MADMTAMPLQNFIASLGNTCLPKILQVCSGVYFQGSIYEISGSEVSFSTGDLVKVISTELLSVCCEDVSGQEKFELPINHTGLFKVIPEEMPYGTLEEMLSLRPVGLESCLPFTFSCRTKMTFDNFIVGPGKALTVVCVERHEGEVDMVRCHVEGQQEASADVCIPLSTKGEFYECESTECFTVQEIMSSPCLRSRRFRFLNIAKSECSLILTPIYQVHAVMSMRKNILKFPSSLEVDVIDVTDASKDVDFVTPLSLTEVFSHKEESFPAVMEILEGPQPPQLLKCSWLSGLAKSSHLIFHKTGKTPMVLLSSLKSRKAQQYFLVSQQYGGRFRRRAREFTSVYELHVASIKEPNLTISVTRNCEEVEEEGLPALSVGDRLVVLRSEMIELPCQSSEVPKQPVEAILCQRLQEPDDGDDDDDDDDDKEEERVKQQDEKEEIFLPLYMPGHFVEVITDKKKYKLRDLGREHQVPLDVKVVSRDSELETDPLMALGSLRVEEAMLEPTIQASFLQSPESCFEIPVQWLSMSVAFTKNRLPWPDDQPPKCRVTSVTEVMDTFFYEFRKKNNSDIAPPPRPPKRNVTSTKSSKKSKSKSVKKQPKSKQQPEVPAKEMGTLTLNKKRPPAPLPPAEENDQPPPVTPRKLSGAANTTCKALPNTYVKMESKKTGSQSGSREDADSDHDYEIVDESFSSAIKKAQENVMYY